MPTYTTHYNFSKPDVNNPDDQNIWGGELNGNFDSLDSTIYTLSQSIGSAIYPVNSLYFSTSSTNPATTFGFGTWVAYAAGQVPIGVGTGTDINSVSQTFTGGQTGGEYVHTLSQAELPAYNISVPFANGSVTGGTGASVARPTGNTSVAAGGSGSSHNNIQPYIAVYIWQRTA